MESCLIGIKSGNTCQEKWYSQIYEFKSIVSLVSAEVELVALRSGISI